MLNCKYICAIVYILYCAIVQQTQSDPQSSRVNAFTLNWGNLDVYAFPPFAIISSVIQKLVKNRAGILLVPDWPNQPWYTVFNEITIPSIRTDLLLLSQSKEIHPLHKPLALIAALVSGI